MILPATTGAILFLCVLVFLALGSWILPWRLGAPKLRFEIVAIDFALGAFLLALAAALTLGSMGSELAFTDSLLVSGHRAQAAVVAAGLIAGIGNVALLASSSLGGLAPSFLIAGALGSVVLAWTSGVRHPTHIGLGTIFGLGALILAASVARLRRAAAPPPARSKGAPKSIQIAGPGITSILLACLAGLAFSGAAQLARYGTSGELGVAPYAAFVFISVPALLSTVAVTFFLFNFPIQGAMLHASAYFGTRFMQHALGIAAGLIWGVGILGCFLVRSAPGEESVVRELGLYSAFGSFVLAAAWALSVGGEPERFRTRRPLVAAALVMLAIAVYFLGYAMTK
ncbi:MAG: hypothetical protein ACJ74Y_05705 [Bryobacteraceae bacterium]